MKMFFFLSMILSLPSGVHILSLRHFKSRTERTTATQKVSVLPDVPRMEPAICIDRLRRKKKAGKET